MVECFTEMSVPLPVRFSCETGCLVKLMCFQLFEHDLTGELFQEITVPVCSGSQA